MPLSIPGLPEGVECVRIGQANADDYEITHTANGYDISKGIRLDSIAQVVVRPADGYEFIYDIRQLSFRPVKKLARPVDIAAALKFTVTNQVDMDKVQSFLEHAREVPGFVEMK